MHEWALAQSVIEATLEVAKDKNILAVEEVVLSIGELQDIDMDVFYYAINQIKEQYDSIRNAEFVHETEPAILRCNNCGHEWEYGESVGSLSDEERENIHFIPETIHIYVHCPECNGVDFKVIKGRGVFIKDVR